MAITNLKVNTDRMRGDAQDLANRLQQSRNRLQTLCTTMDALLGYWDGPASQAEARVYQAEKQNMDQLCRLMDDLIQELTSDASVYSTCEQQVNDAVNSLRI